MSVENKSLFETPFCPLAEVNFWFEFLEHFAYIKLFGEKKHIPTKRSIFTNNEFSEGYVLWKGIGQHTGLVLTGPKAGAIVQGLEDETSMIVVVGRYLDKNGADFDADLAITHLRDAYQTALFEKDRTDIETFMLEHKDEEEFYPHLIIYFCEQFDYPIDKDTFLKNICNQDLTHV